MSDVECPCCNRGVQSRHTYMANLPATVVCTGCGSWIDIDVENTGGGLLIALVSGTLLLAFFWPAVLIMLPLYLVVSTGATRNFVVELVQKPRAELWTINRDTGDVERLNSEYNELRFEEKLSEKIGKLRPALSRRVKPTESTVFKKPNTGFRAIRQRDYLTNQNTIFDSETKAKPDTTRVTH